MVQGRWTCALRAAAALSVGALALGAASRAVAAPSLFLAEPPREVAFVLDGPEAPTLPLLLPFRDASVERHGPMRLYLSGRWGRWLSSPWASYTWEPRLGPTLAEEVDDGGRAEAILAPEGDAPSTEDALAEWGLSPIAPVPAEARERWWADALLEPRARPLVPTFDTLGPNLRGDGFRFLYRLPPVKKIPDWRCRRRPVTIVRYGGESEAIELVRCDGTVAPGAQDRLSLLARPPEVPRPAEELPDEPDESSWRARREWLPGVKLVHPRLLWALQRLADEFPRRAIYVVSGYRPGARVGGGESADDGEGHRSKHAEGRALDLFVHGVRNEDVLAFCRTLRDVGCGYYPSSSFVHLDVRRAHSGPAFWIDASAPGEPSRYVDSWPGVADAGAMSWVAPERRVPGP